MVKNKLIKRIFFCKKWLLILLSVFLPTNAMFALNEDDIIIGHVMNKENSFIEYATIQLFNSDSTLITSSISDSVGFFLLSYSQTLAKYPLCLKVSHIGYVDKTLKLSVSKKQPIQVIMIKSNYILNEVTVRGSWIRRRDGNLVVDVSHVPGIQNFQADKLLKQLPGVTKNSAGGYELNGKSVIFYVNGVKQNITTQSLNALLSALPATTLSEIELVEINNGKYPANSNNAVIDIKTKKDFVNGYSHQFNLTTGFFNRGLESLKPSYFYMTKKNRWLFYNTVAFSDDNYYGVSTDSTHFDNNTIYNNKTTNGGMYPCVQYNAKLTYTLPNENQIDFSAFIYYDFGHIHSTINSNNYYNNKKAGKSKLYYKRYENDDLWSGTLSYTIPQSKKKIYGSFYYNAIYGGLRSDNDYYYEDTDVKFQTSDLKMTGWMHTLNADLQSEFDKIKLIYGLNLQYNWMNDRAKYNYLNNGTSYNSRFYGREFLLSAYTGVYYKINERLKVSTSVRIENTNYKLDYKTENYKDKENYIDIFPSVLGYYTSDKYSATFGLVSGIERPKYEYMIPGKRKITETYYTLGNPNLSPSHNFSVLFNNTFFKFINLNLRYSYYKNAVGLVYYNKDGILYQDYLNYVNLENYNISLSIPFRLLKDKLYGQLSGRWTYVNNKKFLHDFTPPTGRKNSYWINSYNFSMSYNITNRLNFNTYINYFPRHESVQNYTYSALDTEAGLSYSFCKKKNLIFEFNVNNIFDSNDKKRNIYFAENFRNINVLRNGPVFYFTLCLKLDKGEKVIEEYREYTPNINRMKK